MTTKCQLSSVSKALETKRSLLEAFFFAEFIFRFPVWTFIDNVDDRRPRETGLTVYFWLQSADESWESMSSIDSVPERYKSVPCVSMETN